MTNLSETSIKTQRLKSLDVLRGFDMFWITGGASLLTAVAQLSGAEWMNALSLQMEHAVWEGFYFYDLIFPLFMFIAGVAIPLSVDSKRTKGFSKRAILRKSAERMLLLILLGLLFNGVFRDGFENARYASVLGQIGIAYFFASFIIVYSDSPRASVAWLGGILLGVTVLQLFVPVPGTGAGVLTPEGCINGYIDQMLLPGRLAYGPGGKMVHEGGIFDALGILCIVSAIGITLMGTMAGKVLQNAKITGYRKTVVLAAAGLILILAALLLSPHYPIIKKCWTTTYNLLAGGISLMLIALFYLIIDVWNFQKWSFFFRVIGMNALFIYLLNAVVPVGELTDSFVGWAVRLTGDAGPLIHVLGYVTGEWLLLYLMYRKNIFLKV